MNVSKSIQSREPVGSITNYPSATVPFGYLACDGSAVSRSTYARLFDTIGVTFGVGNGSTTFNLPNKGGKVGVGANGTGDYILGLSGGLKDVTLISNELPSHTHICNAHTHTVFGIGQTQQVSGFPWYAEETTQPTATTISSATATNSYVGGGASHSNMQPYMALLKIIKY